MQKSQLGVHQGQALRHFADRYPTITEVILELVQNCLDVTATHIWVTIDLKNKRRRLTVRDNGTGATVSMFEKALATIGRSVKESGKLGRYGLGLVSPFGKCANHTFTTCHRSTPEDFNRWTFERDMLEQRTVSIPRESVPGLHYHNADRGGKEGVPWRTEMRLDDITDDRIQGAIDTDDIQRLIVQKYGIVMREQGAVVHLTYIDPRGQEHATEITAAQRLGKPLPPVTYKGHGGVETTIRLFLAERTGSGRHGEVLFGETDNPYRLTPKQFLFSVSSLLDTDVAQALRSGVFEGEVVCNKVTLASSRRSFEQNDALLEMLAALCSWFHEHGKAHIEATEAENEGRRYRELGMRSLPVLSAVLDKADLSRLVSKFRFGHIGRNHATDGQRQVGGSDFTGTAVKASTPGHHGKGGGGNNTTTESTERPGHTPWVVEGTDGSKRIRVRDGSTGLIFVYAEMPRSKKLCELNRDTGELMFNIRHPDWVAADTSETAIMRFQEIIALRELSLLEQPQQFRQVQEMPNDTFNRMAALYAAHGDRVRGTRPGRPRTKK